MEQKQFDAMMEDWLERQNAPREQDKALEWARRAGITDGTRPHAFATRGETAAMLHRALEYFFEQIIGILREG